MASKKELAYNATKWVKEFKEAKAQKKIDPTVGTILILFDVEDMSNSAVLAGTINREGVKDACRAILKKLDASETRIVTPYDVN